MGKGNPNWIKGVSGNPNGRAKKGQTFTDIIETLGSENYTEINGKKVLWKDAAAMKLYSLAMEGDVSSLKYLIDRIDGRPKETINIENIEQDKLSDLLNQVGELKGKK